MSNERSIRDPIQNYIYLTQFESVLIQHPLFQRLRFITQNGVAYYTYPSNKNCRFLHSLGTMAIAGDIFLRSVDNIYASNQIEYLSLGYAMIKQKCEEARVTIPMIASSLNLANDKTQIMYGLNVHITEDRENRIPLEKQLLLTKNIIFQSLRLAALLHDLGHFPFSHIIENAFEKYFEFSICTEEAHDDIYYNSLIKPFENMDDNPYKKIHENIGVKLLDIIMPSDLNQYNKLCRTFAELILNKCSEEFNDVIHPLRTIISSEIDSDRLDYTLRDPRASGLELGAYDLERLIYNFTLYKDNNKFKYLIKVQALSSIESFFHQRYLIYKYLIFHHSKVRMDELISEITIILLNIYKRRNPTDVYVDLHKILKEYNFNYLWESHLAEYHDYFYCTDYWYYTLLQRLQLFLADKKEAFTEDEIIILERLLNIFLFRQTENMLSLFKRYDSYYDFINQIREDVREPNENLFLEKFNNSLSYVTLLLKFKEIKRSIYESHNVTVSLALTPPKLIKCDSDGNSILEIVHESDYSGSSVKKPASYYSPYLKSLNTMQFNELAFHLFLFGDNIRKKDKEVIVRDIKKTLITFFVNIYMGEES